MGKGHFIIKCNMTITHQLIIVLTNNSSPLTPRLLKTTHLGKKMSMKTFQQWNSTQPCHISFLLTVTASRSDVIIEWKCLWCLHFTSDFSTEKELYPFTQKTGEEHDWPVAAAGGLVDGMKHIGLLAVPCNAWEDQYCGAGRGFWVGHAGLIVHPVQRDLTTINRTDQLTEGRRERREKAPTLKKCFIGCVCPKPARGT